VIDDDATADADDDDDADARRLEVRLMLNEDNGNGVSDKQRNKRVKLIFLLSAVLLAVISAIVAWPFVHFFRTLVSTFFMRKKQENSSVPASCGKDDDGEKCLPGRLCGPRPELCTKNESLFRNRGEIEPILLICEGAKAAGEGKKTSLLCFYRSLRPVGACFTPASCRYET